LIALDTNILVRVIARDESSDPEQRKAAQALLSSDQDMFIPVTVVQEVEWVLRAVYRVASEEIADIFSDLLEVENLIVDRAAAVSKAVDWYRAGLDFSDALHLSLSSHCDQFATFDRKFETAVDRLRIKPQVFQLR